MAHDLRIVLPDRPGVGRQLFKAIAAAGINIEGLCADLRPGERWVSVHILVDDAAATRAAVEKAGFEVSSDQAVELIELEDHPGAVHEVLKSVAEKGTNIEVIYMATRTRLVIGTEEMHPERPGVRMEDASYP